ncbi:MAG: hypothetical protein M1820_004333 [Bogoriella megaspora]|nr:MAG: hypothetical protein M1820_004333 [Bogoriella megaspora]
MSSRFPISEMPDPSIATQIDVAVHELHGENPPFQWKDSNGSFLGLYGPLSHSPIVTPAFWGMGRAMTHPDSIKRQNYELALLGLFSVIDAPYPRYCHRLLAKENGITDEQYDCGLQGTIPNGLSHAGVSKT